jgi:hypothetical protein
MKSVALSIAHCEDLGAGSLPPRSPGVVSDWLVVDPLCLPAFFSCSPLLPDESELADEPALRPASSFEEPDELLPAPDDDLSPAPLGVSDPVPPGAMTSALEDPAFGCAADVQPPVPVAELVGAPVPCASATENTDAANTNDNDRIVIFKVMSRSCSQEASTMQ